MAAFNLGDIFVTLKSNTDSLKRGIKDLGNFAGEAKNLGGKISSGLRTVSKVLAVAAVGLTAYAKKATDFTLDLYKTSKILASQIGVSITEASRLTAAFVRMGLEAGNVQQMLGIFSKNISAATAGVKDQAMQQLQLRADMAKTRQEIKDTTEQIRKHGDKSGALDTKLQSLNVTLLRQTEKLKAASSAFDVLGINVLDANGKQKDFETVLFEVADKFQKMPDGIDKTALSMQLFGRSGKDMIRVLNLGSDGIRELEKQADKLGLTLTTGTIAKIQDLIEEQKKLKEKTDALKIAVGTATTPVLTKYNDVLNQILQKVLDMNGPFRDLTVMILAFGGPVATALSGLAGFLGNISSIGPKMLRMIRFFSLWALAIASIGILLKPVIDKMGGWSGVLQKLKDKAKGLTPFLNEIKDAAISIWNAWQLLLTGDFKGGIFGMSKDDTLIQWIYKIRDGFKSIVDTVKEVIDWLGPRLKPAFDMLMKALTPIWTSIKALAAAFWQDLLPSLKQIWDAVVRLWNALNPALMMALGAVALFIGATLIAALYLGINVLKIIVKVIGLVASAISNVIKWIANFIGWIGNIPGAAMRAVRSVLSWFGKLPDRIGDIVGRVVKWFKDLPGRVGKAASGVGDALSGPFKWAFNKIVDFWNGTAGKLSFHAPDWVPGMGGKGWSMPKLSKMAVGTPFFEGGPAQINEFGPETAVLPRGTRVITAEETRKNERSNGGNTYIINLPKGLTLARSGTEVADIMHDAIKELDLKLAANGRPKILRANP